MIKYPHVPCAHGVDVNDECQGCKDLASEITNNIENMDFIEKQKELGKSRHLIDDFHGHHIISPEDLDTLITQVITSTGEELMRLAEGERWEDPGDFGNPDDKLIREQWAGHERALDTLKKHITKLTGVE